MPQEMSTNGYTADSLKDAEASREREASLHEKQMSSEEIAREVNIKILPSAQQKIESSPLKADKKNKLKTEINYFIQGAAFSDARDSLQRFNADTFDIDGKEGLSEHEFRNFEEALNKAISDIISLQDFDEFVEVQEDISKDIDSRSAKKQLESITGGRSATDWLSDKLGSLGDVSPQDREKLLNAKLSGGFEHFITGIGYSALHEAPQMVEDLMMLVADAGSMGSISIMQAQYLYYRFRSGSKEYEMKLQAMIEAHPIIGLLHLLTSEKGLDAAKAIFDKISSPSEWTAQGIVQTITSILGILAGGAGAVRLGARFASTAAREGSAAARAASAVERGARRAQHVLERADRMANTPANMVTEGFARAIRGKEAQVVPKALNDNTVIETETRMVGNGGTVDVPQNTGQRPSQSAESTPLARNERQVSPVEVSTLESPRTLRQETLQLHIPDAAALDIGVTRLFISNTKDQGLALFHPKETRMERLTEGIRITVGRDLSNDIVIPNAASQQLIVEVKNGRVIITDNSSRGTKLTPIVGDYRERPAMLERLQNFFRGENLSPQSPIQRSERPRTQQEITRGDPNTPAAIRRVERATSVQEVPRRTEVVNVGDLHGNIQIMRENLKSLGLIDESGRWIGGDSRLVFHGDILGDRGTQSLEAFREIMKLRREARSAGGDITVLAGNHEDFAISYLTGRNTADGANWSNYGDQAAGVLEFAREYINPNIQTYEDLLRSGTNGPEVLRVMRNHPEGRRMLEDMCEMKLVEQIDDTLFTHTDLTSGMTQLIQEMGIDRINEAYQQGLRAILLDGANPSEAYNRVMRTFLDTENRHYLNEAEALALKQQGINRSMHGHSDHGNGVAIIGGIEIRSVDHSAGKGGLNMNKRSIGRIDQDGNVTTGLETQAIEARIPYPKESSSENLSRRAIQKAHQLWEKVVNTIKTKSSNSETQPNWKNLLQRNIKDVNWPGKKEFLANKERHLENVLQPFGHGSTSASLIGASEMRGLIPTGDLLKAGKVPFSGELDAGLSGSKGVNNRGVSLSEYQFQSGGADIEYAIGNFNGLENSFDQTIVWNPQRGRELLTKLRSQLLEQRENIQNGTYQKLGISNEMAQELYVSRLESQIRIQELRIEQFEKLTPFEKELITNPFPIIYRMDVPRENMIPMLTKAGGEVGYEGKIEFNKHIKCVLVPAEKIELVTEYFRSKGIVGVDIVPIEFIGEAEEFRSQRLANMFD